MAKKQSQQANEVIQGDRTVTQNRRAFHDYFIDETIEAGMVLTGRRSSRFAMARSRSAKPTFEWTTMNCGSSVRT